MLGKATLPMQAIVLSASMALSKQLSGPAGEAVRLLPADRYERGIFLVSSVVRLVISPLVGLASVLACRHFGWLPADRMLFRGGHHQRDAERAKHGAATEPTGQHQRGGADDVEHHPPPVRALGRGVDRLGRGLRVHLFVKMGVMRMRRE